MGRTTMAGRRMPRTATIMRMPVMATITITITRTTIRVATIIRMATDRALGLLLAWTSPSYPVGAFSYSHGLEAAVEDGAVRDAATLVAYVSAVISRGGGWVDAVLFARAYEAWDGADDRDDYAPYHDDVRDPDPDPDRHSRESGYLPGAGAHGRLRATSGDPRFRGDDGVGERGEEAHPADDADDATSREARFDAVAELAVAFRGSSETALESRQMGRSFLSVTQAAWPHPALDAFAERHVGRPIAHAIIGALACAVHGVPLAPALIAWLHGTAANLVSAGVRLVPLGQTDGQIATARLLPLIADVAARARVTDLDDLGTAAPLVELASLAHETQYTRLFRS